MGPAQKGERIAEATPQNHWQVLTTLGMMSVRGIEAVMATDGEVFRVYVDQALCPTLTAADMLILDNLRAHKVAGIRELVQAHGARLLYLPP